jgi:hypothetical protein
VSQRLTTGLADVVRFAVAHPKEQVILDIQHVDLTGDKKVDRYYTAALDRVLRSYRVDGTAVCSRAWSRKAIPTNDARLGTDVPISQAWTADRNILVLRAAGELPDRSCYRSREKALWSPWPNTQDPAASTAANAGYLQARSDALAGTVPCATSDGNRCGLFVDQMQLSIQLPTQVACLTGAQSEGCSLAAFARLVNDTVVDQLMRWRSVEGRPVNIAIVDFYEDSAPAYAAGLIAMNDPAAGG